MRTRIKGFKKLYENAYWYSGNSNDMTVNWSTELTEKFLNLNPRPTIRELKQVVYPLGLKRRPLDSQNQYTHIGMAPDPDKPGYLKYDMEEYKILLKQEAKKRQEIMQQIINSRSE